MEKFDFKRGTIWGLLGAAMLGVTGCQTYQAVPPIGPVSSGLLSDNSFSFQMEPLLNGPVKVYQVAGERKFLVVYDEYSERTSAVKPRAYYLLENKRRIEQRKKPVFVPPDIAGTMLPVPAGNHELENFGPGYRVEFGHGNREFTMYYDDQPLQTFALPAYDDEMTVQLRFWLTPPAMIADVSYYSSIVALYAGLLFGYAYFGGSYVGPFFWPGVER